MHRYLGWLAVVLTVALGAFPYVLKFDAANPGSLAPFSPLLVYFQSWAISLGLFLGPALGLVKWFRDQLTSPWKEKSVTRLLEEVRSDLFHPQFLRNGDPVSFNRITVFRYRRFHLNFRLWKGPYRPFRRRQWFWSGWLIPIQRSGHYGKARTAFPIRSDGSVEGVAGQAWITGVTVPQDELPAISVGSSPRAKQTYAKDSFVSVEWVEQRLLEPRPLSRCFCAIPLEINKKIWGVIVLDSVHPGAIIAPSLAAKLHVRLQSHLATILERN